MFKSRGRKIFRDVWSRKGRTAMASLAIFFGVLGVVILVSAGDLMLSQLKKDLKQDELAMQVIFVTLPAGLESADVDDAAYLETLRAIPGVTSVEGRAIAPLPCMRPGFRGNDECFIIAASEPFDEIAQEPMSLIKGRYPVAGQNELAIEKRMAQGFQEGVLGVGDELVMTVLGEDGDQVQETWTIAGIVFQPYYPMMIGFEMPDKWSSIFTTYEDAQHLAGFAGFSSIYVRYLDYPTAEEQAKDFTVAVAGQTPYMPVADAVGDPAEFWLITMVQDMTGVLSMLAMVAMIVSGFLVISVINNIVVEQKQQIGVMKSLGATRWDNFVMYAGIALIYGVIGTVPAVLLGVYVGFEMGVSLAEMPGSMIEEFSISSQGVIMGAVMGLLIPVLFSLVPVFFGTRVSILQAMTDLGISGDYGRGLFARMINALPLPINVRQAFSNVTRKKARLFLTWLVLMFAVGSFMGVYSVFSSLSDQFAAIFNTFGHDLVIMPNQGQDFDQVRELILERVDVVQDVYAGSGANIEVEGYLNPQLGSSALWANGIDPSTETFVFEYKEGEGWQKDPTREGVVLASSLANALDKSLGDRIFFTVGGQDYEEEIIGVVSFPFDSIFMDWLALAQKAGFTDLNGKPMAGILAVKLQDPDPSPMDAEMASRQVLKALREEGIPAGYNNVVEQAEEVSEQALIFGMIFGMAAVVMAAVGAIGLLAALSMAVFERQKEIGVMRSIGAGSLTVAGQFLVEGLSVGLAAWIVGAPFAFLFSQALVGMLPFAVEISFAPISLVVGLVGMIVIATVSSLWPSLSAARKTVAQIIRYQ